MIDPLNERLSSTRDLLAELDELSTRLREQGEQQADLLKRKNELVR